MAICDSRSYNMRAPCTAQHQNIYTYVTTCTHTCMYTHMRRIWMHKYGTCHSVKQRLEKEQASSNKHVSMELSVTYKTQRAPKQCNTTQLIWESQKWAALGRTHTVFKPDVPTNVRSYQGSEATHLAGPKSHIQSKAKYLNQWIQTQYEGTDRYN